MKNGKSKQAKKAFSSAVEWGALGITAVLAVPMLILIALIYAVRKAADLLISLSEKDIQ